MACLLRWTGSDHDAVFKTSSLFDSTTANPEWLGHAPVRLRRLIPE
jgi:hypothetical protein